MSKGEEHRRYSTQGSYQSTTIGDASFDYIHSHVSSAVHLSRMQAKKQKALLDKKTNQDGEEVNFVNYKPLGTVDSVIKNLTLYEKMEVVNPNYVHEREIGEEIILNKAAQNYFTVRLAKRQLRKPTVQKKEEAQLKAFEKKISQKRSFDREGVQLSDGQVAGCENFVRSGRYQCRKGSKNGPGESVFSVPYGLNKTVNNASSFQSRPSTSFQNSSPGPAAYEIHRLENKETSFSFSRQKRKTHDVSQMCKSVGYAKKPRMPLEKVSTAKDFVDMTTVNQKNGFPFSKLERGLYSNSSHITSALGPGHYHNADKAYKSFYESSEKYSFPREQTSFILGSERKHSQPIIRDLYDSTKNTDLTQYSTNFQKFSELERFSQACGNFSESNTKRRFSSNKLFLLRKKRKESEDSCIQKNREIVTNYSPHMQHFARLQQITRNNLRHSLARKTSSCKLQIKLAIEKQRILNLKEQQFGKAAKYQKEREEETLILEREWKTLVAVGALGNAVGQYFLSRYHTRKKSLKFLGICYYISRFMGKAKIWLRKTRLKKASTVIPLQDQRLTNFVRLYVRPKLAHNLRMRKKAVITFLKKMHYSQKLQEAALRLNNTLSNIQRWYRRRIFYNTVLKAMSNYAWWLYEQEVICEYEGIKSSGKANYMSIEELMNDEQPLIPIRIRVLFMNAFMRHRRLKYLQAIKFWEVERDYLLKREKKNEMQAKKFQGNSSRQEYKVSEIRLPPRPKFFIFLKKSEVCEMIQIAWQAQDIWKYDKHEPQLIRKIERFITDVKISKIKRRKVLVADSSAEGKKFKREVDLVREQFMGNQHLPLEQSSFSSDEESKRHQKRRSHSPMKKKKKKK